MSCLNLTLLIHSEGQQAQLVQERVTNLILASPSICIVLPLSQLEGTLPLPLSDQTLGTKALFFLSFLLGVVYQPHHANNALPR